GAPAAVLARKPYMWRLCDMLLPGTALVYRIAAWLPADLVITDSNAVTAQAHRFSGRLGPFKTVYPGTALVAPASQVQIRRVRADLGLPDDCPVVAVIGRLQRWKGQADFLRAVPVVHAR